MQLGIVMPPKILYHYCSLETLSKIIGDVTSTTGAAKTRSDGTDGAEKPSMISRIQMTSYHHLNDPGESLTIASLYGEKLHEAYFRKILDKSKTFVFCFSEEKDNLTMWRSYAHDGCGICIGFNTSKLDKIIQRIKDEKRIKQDFLKVDLVSIKYVNKGDSPDTLKKGVGKRVFSDLQSYSRGEDINNLLDKALECWSIKSSDYGVEKEWRLIVTFEDKYFQNEFMDYILNGKLAGAKFNNFDLQHRFHGDRMVEQLFLRLDSGCISELILGPKCSALEKEIKRYLKLHFNEDVKVSKSKKNYR